MAWAKAWNLLCMPAAELRPASKQATADARVIRAEAKKSAC